MVRLWTTIGDVAALDDAVAAFNAGQRAEGNGAAEVATSRLISLFAGSVEALVPALVDLGAPPSASTPFPVTGRLSEHVGTRRSSGWTA